jgi:hypothetical protein
MNPSSSYIKWIAWNSVSRPPEGVLSNAKVSLSVAFYTLPRSSIECAMNQESTNVIMLGYLGGQLEMNRQMESNMRMSPSHA